MKYACKLCGISGDPSLFYVTSAVRCKRCVNRISRERYRTKYRAARLAEFAIKDIKRKSVILPLNDTEKAYAAGLIDGEGCIRIIHRGRMGGKVFRVGQFTLMVEVTNTDCKMIDWLREKFGGTVSFLPESKEENRKARWHWRLAANNALACLDAIYPYVRTKQKQVILGRRFQRYAQRTGRKQNLRITALHEKFYARLRELNRRGLAKPT